MPLRDVFEKLATDFAYEILALVIAAPMEQTLQGGRRAPGGPSTQGPDAAVEVAPDRPRPWYASPSRIRIPAEKHQLPMDELLLSTSLADVLCREGYVVLGDLDGHTLGDLTRHRGFGRECHRELRCILETMGTRWSFTPTATPPEPVVAKEAARSRSKAATVEPTVPARGVRVRTREKVKRALVIRVPAEKASIRIDQMPVSVRLYNALTRHGYVVLGDLDGRTFGHLYQHRGFGRACLEDLRGVLHDLKIVPAVPLQLLHVPPFALGYRLDDLNLSLPARKFVRRSRFTVLGELHENARTGAGTRGLGELAMLIDAMTSAGPPAPLGLLDLLDAGLDALKERHREVLLLRFGASGEKPLTLAEIGRRIGVTGERVRQMQRHALETLPPLAGPAFGDAIRDLGGRVSAEGADVAGELERSWRKGLPVSPRGLRPWANHGFYLRLLTKLSPAIEAAVFPPRVRAEPAVA